MDRITKDGIRHIYPIGQNSLIIYDWERLDGESTPIIWENVCLKNEKNEVIWVVNGMAETKGWSPNWSRGFKYAENDSNKWHLVDLSSRIYGLNIETGKVHYVGFTKL